MARQFTRLRSLAPLVILSTLAVGLGCSIFNASAPAHDPAKQAAIDHRQVLIDARAAYSATERFITNLHRTGAISTARGTQLVTALQTDVRPLLDVSQAALVSGDFDQAILRFTAALANVQQQVSATAGAATQPALLRIPPSAPPVRQVPVRAATFPVAVILGEIALAALQAYRRKKAEEQAAGINDDARTNELDKQLAEGLADNDAADAEARQEFGLPPAAAGPAVT